MRLTAPWLTKPAVTAVLDALEHGGAQAWFVGGCVRDGLLGLEAGDIDIATDAPPDRVTELAEGAGLRAVPTGAAHGTITVVSDHFPVEVTTLRRDVETDGRRATVAFTDRLEDDAHRRDFTVNALYATRDGTVLDPTGEGLDDLKARRIRFIGDPHDRIREDYLRILRFFRFHAWYAATGEGLDADALAASAELADGLERLPGERIGAEMRKLLSAPDPAPALAGMAQTGVLGRVLPGADHEWLAVLVDVEGDAPPDAMRRLAILGGEDVDTKLRLSRAEAQVLSTLKDGMAGAAPAWELGYRHGARLGRDIVLLRAALLQQPPYPRVLTDLQEGAKAVFPVKAADLMPDFQGPALGEELARLERDWIDSRFLKSAEDLLG